MLRRSEKLIKIHLMSLEDKVTEAFKLFGSSKYERIDMLVTSINQQADGITIGVSTLMDTPDSIVLYVDGIGGLSKYCGEEKDQCEIRFEIEGKLERMRLYDMTLNKCSEICLRVIPFMLSLGKNRKSIPLLVNDFPEFAQWALEYTNEFA